MSKAFTFFADPGHGWLKVTRADCLDLGMTCRDFSAFSYIGDNDTIYLEEDCDAPKFLSAYEAKRGAPVIRESYCNRESHIRRMRRNDPTA